MGRAGAKWPLRHIWVVGAVLYAVVLWWIGLRRIVPALGSMDARLLVAMAGMIACATGVRVLKWRLVLGAGAGSVDLYFLSKAGGDWSPSRTGELAPLMLRQYRAPRFAAWIIADRLLEAAATLGLGALGLGAYALMANQGPAGALSQAHLGRMLLAVGVALAALVVAPAIVLTRRNLFTYIATTLNARPRLRRIGRWASFLADLTLEVRALGAKLPIASAMTVLATSMDVVVGILLFRSFGFALPFMLMAVVQCAHALASAIPFTPSATGLPHLLAAGLIYQAAEVPADVLGAAVGVSIAVANIVFWSAFAICVRGSKQSPKTSRHDRVFNYLAEGGTLYRYENDALAKLKDLTGQKGVLLDVGCGDGAITAALGAQRAVGFDFSRRCAELAARRGVHALVADARMPLPFADGAFDTVYCVDVLHHLPPSSWEGVLGEFHRVMKDCGQLALAEPDARYALVRWTQAPGSLIRVAPCVDEPAIYPADLEPLLVKTGFSFQRRPIRIDGDQVRRDIFPSWQRLMKAPFVLALAAWHGSRPNKFVFVAKKTAAPTALSRGRVE